MSPRFIVKSAIIIFLLTAFNTLISQEKTVATASWSPEEKISKSEITGEIIGMVDNNIYLRTYTQGLSFKREHFINCYDAETMEKKAVTLNFISRGRDRWLESSLIFGNKLVLLNTNKTKARFGFYLKTVDLHYLRFEKGELEIFSFEEKIKPFSGLELYRYRAALSPDQSKLALRLEYKDKQGNSKIGVLVLNDNFEKIADASFQRSPELGNYRIVDFHVTNSGDTYLIGKDFSAPDEDETISEFELVKVVKGSSSPLTQKFKFNDKLVDQVKIREREDGDLALAGFHSKFKSGNIAGLFSMILDPVNLSTKQSVNHDFDFEFLTSRFSDQALRKAQKSYDKESPNGRFHYSLDYMEMTDDGGYYLIGDQNMAVFKSYKQKLPSQNKYDNASITRTTVDDPSDDLLIIKISESGDVVWKSRIAKNMHGTHGSLDWANYTCKVDSNRLHIIHYDHNKNLILSDTPPKPLNKPGASIFVVDTFDRLGQQRRSQIVPYDGLAIDPEISVQTLSDEVFFLGRSGKRIAFLKATFN